MVILLSLNFPYEQSEMPFDVLRAGRTFTVPNSLALPSSSNHPRFVVRQSLPPLPESMDRPDLIPTRPCRCGAHRDFRIAISTIGTVCKHRHQASL